MTEETVGCKTMSEEDFLIMIENNPMLKEKLEEIGVGQDDEGLNIPLNYSDLLTDEEKKRLKKRYKKYGFKKKDGVYSWFLKFQDKGGMYVCYTDVICDNCYKGLLEYRAEKIKKEEKKKKKK